MVEIDERDFDSALAVLNAARAALNPNIFIITLADEDGGLHLDCGEYDGTAELEAFVTSYQRAADTVEAALRERPHLRVVEDYRGRWVAVCQA